LRRGSLRQLGDVSFFRWVLTLRERNKFVKLIAESELWREYLPKIETL